MLWLGVAAGTGPARRRPSGQGGIVTEWAATGGEAQPTGYRKIFDPPLKPPPGAPDLPMADRAEATAYVYDEELVLAVNVALATGRPLLMRGRPGTGKSSLARNVALHLRRRFYPRTISSRTQARDLLWTVDDVARLSDATSGGGARDRAQYVLPGPLWWAFSPWTAAWRGLPPSGGPPPLADPNEGEPAAAGAVVLLDEIDKADPDVPNDLLEPLGLYQFRTERGDVVQARPDTAPLVILTTNEERDLPKAFLRRCVVHELPLPTRRRLRDIAEVRLGVAPDGLYEEVVRALAGPARSPGAPAEQERVEVSIAEFLDAVAAASQLGIRPGHPRWDAVLAATTDKPATIDLR
jgi:MoxR-like ATPase